MSRFLTNGLLAALVLVGLVSIARSDDRDDRDRRAKAAIAIARSMPSASSVAVAPAPRPVLPKDYAIGRKESLLDQAPLVVYVSCDGPKVDGAITCFVPAPTFGEVTGPAIVVGYPSGDRLLIEKTLPCPAPDGALQKAVENAAKKIDAQPAKQMPGASKPAPLDTQIRHTGCICGDACKCKTGECPNRCPVATTPEPIAAAPVIVGYTYQKVCNGNGTCRIVQVPVYR